MSQSNKNYSDAQAYRNIEALLRLYQRANPKLNRSECLELMIKEERRFLGLDIKPKPNKKRKKKKRQWILTALRSGWHSQECHLLHNGVLQGEQVMNYTATKIKRGEWMYRGYIITLVLRQGRAWWTIRFTRESKGLPAKGARFYFEQLGYARKYIDDGLEEVASWQQKK